MNMNTLATKAIVGMALGFQRAAPVLPWLIILVLLVWVAA